MLLEPYIRYVDSGEINSTVADAVTAMKAIETMYAGRPGVTLDHLDGLTVSADNWWFNVRPATPSRCFGSMSRPTPRRRWSRVRDEVLARVRAEA